jgi:hypothetical protein
MKENSKNIFFIRHENDFDMLLPLITCSNEPIVCIISSVKAINHPAWDSVRPYVEKDFELNLFEKYKTIVFKGVYRVIFKLRLNIFFKSFCDYVLFIEDNYIAKIVLKSLSNLKPNLKLNLVFDHSVANVNKVIIKGFKDANFSSLMSFSLPHGFTSITNSMTSFNSIELEILPEKYNMYDKIIVSDDLQYKNFIRGGIHENKLLMLNSLKYTISWKEYFDSTFSCKALDFKCKNRITLLVILTQLNANISKNEFFRMMKIILNIDYIDIIIKAHPRATYDVVRIKKYFKDLSKIKFHNGHLHDAISSSDIIISMPSSAIIDAVMYEKPVLYLPYMSSSTLNPYLVEFVTVLNNPDEFYIFMQSLNDNIKNIKTVNLEIQKLDDLILEWNENVPLNLSSKSVDVRL